MNSSLCLLTLFQQLRQAGMKLTPEQYELLQQALQQGHGIQGWEDLKRVCRLLWVKPSLDYDGAVFDRVFDRYQQAHQREFQSSIVPDVTSASLQRPTPDIHIPQVPPRRMPAAEAISEVQAPIAVKTQSLGLGTPKKTDWVVTPTAVPLSLETIERSWRSLRRPLRKGVATEVDLEATLNRIYQNGFFDDVVLRPAQRQQGELLLLIDDSEVMLPFRPALFPLITAVEEQRISPSQLYRFTVYPDDYLYDWKRPYQAIPLKTVLSQAHQNRTIVLIVSDAGAASRTDTPERRQGIATFLESLLPCVQQLLWLNPLPPDRWNFTTAQSVAQALNGRMFPLDATSLPVIARQPASDLIINLWSLLFPTSPGNEKI